MKTDELREKYLAFFETKGHRRCPSDVLVPTWDPSVLFTPAGMNQFKDHFLGKVKLEFTRATTCQKCLRTGDIETSAARRITTRFSRCWATSASATTSSATRSTGRGSF